MKKEGIIHICFSCDNNYIPHLGVTIASILKNNPQHAFWFHILDDELTTVNKQKIETLKSVKPFELDYVKINRDDFKDCPIDEKKSHFKLPTYYRLKIPSFFPQLERILYLDADLVVLGDLGPLYHVDFKGNYFAMARDPVDGSVERLGLKYGKYFNAGVAVFNIKKCNADDMEHKFFDACRHLSDKLLYVDQDVLNCVADGKILELPPKYNSQFDSACWDVGDDIMRRIDDTVIVHYVTGRKPWNNPRHPLNAYYYKYLSDTPWRIGVWKYRLRKLTWCFWDVQKNDRGKKVRLFGLTIRQKGKKIG